MDKLKEEYKSLVNKFSAAEKSETLSFGDFDLDVRIFVVHLFEKLILVHEDEDKYFEVLNLLNVFLDDFLYGDEWEMWCGVDLSKLSEVSSGFVEDKNKLIEIKNFYLF